MNRSRAAKKILIFNKHVSSSWNFGLGVLNAAWMSGHSSIRTCNPVVPRPRPAISCLLRDQNPWPSLPPANCLGFLNFAMFYFVSFKLLEKSPRKLARVTECTNTKLLTMLVYHLPLFSHMRAYRHLREEVPHRKAITEALWLGKTIPLLLLLIIIILMIKR